MGRPDFRSRAWLVRNGVAVAEAFAMDQVWADALSIAFGEMNGGKWNWETLKWADPK